MDPIRRWGWIYFGVLVLVVIVGYIPAFEDAEGNLFGLFKLDLYDDALHLASGLWGGIAAWRSRRAAEQYFRIFGPLYFLDGVLGQISGMGYLDGGIFLYGPIDLPLLTRFFANLPHLILGGWAIYVGYAMSRKTA